MRGRRRPLRLGRVWRVVEGRLVVEGERVPRLGAKVYDSSMREVGTVSSVLGPTERFFIEVKPRKPVNYAQGEPLYIMEGDSRG